MTYEEYIRLDRDAQVRACVNDMALVAASQDAISNVDDLAVPASADTVKVKRSVRNVKVKNLRMIGAALRGGGARYKAVALATGTEEATVRRIVEAYEEIDPRRGK